VNDVDNGNTTIITTTIIFFTTSESVSGTNINIFGSTGGSVLALYLKTSIVKDERVFIGIGDHFVTREYIFPDLHVVFFCFD
jgi:hypothetical protein